MKVQSLSHLNYAYRTSFSGEKEAQKTTEKTVNTPEEISKTKKIASEAFFITLGIVGTYFLVKAGLHNKVKAVDSNKIKKTYPELLGIEERIARMGTKMAVQPVEHPNLLQG